MTCCLREITYQSCWNVAECSKGNVGLVFECLSTVNHTSANMSKYIYYSRDQRRKIVNLTYKPFFLFKTSFNYPPSPRAVLRTMVLGANAIIATR